MTELSFHKELGDAVGPVFGAGEHHGAADLGVAQKLPKKGPFVDLVHEVHRLLDLVGGLVI